MTDLIAPIVTIAVMALFAAAWVFYLRRVRQGRADPVVDPSWPSNLRPMPRHLHDPADVEVETSMYFDPNEAKLSRRDPEAD